MSLFSIANFYTDKTDRMDITLDVNSQNIFIQQKWKYNWKKKPTTAAWTYPQKKSFHNIADRLLWRQWSNHFKLKCKGTSDFVKKYNDSEFSITFDIKWVTSNEHWNVNVKKIPSGDFSVSSVNWTSKIINLDTEDLKEKERKRSVKTYKQYPVSHEFGHAVGNTSHIRGMHADEYKSTSAFKLDLLSRMNIGNKLRKRHLDYIVKQLNKMIPNTTFYVDKM